VEGLDPRCFKAECVKSLVKISTSPSSIIEDLARKYLGNLSLALKVASDLGLALYPLGTSAEEARPARVHDSQATAGGTSEGLL
jgi:hypothetical protein